MHRQSATVRLPDWKIFAATGRSLPATMRLKWIKRLCTAAGFRVEGGRSYVLLAFDDIEYAIDVVNEGGTIVVGVFNTHLSSDSSTEWNDEEFGYP